MGGRTLDQFYSRQQARAKNARHDKQTAANSRDEKDKDRTAENEK